MATIYRAENTDDPLRLRNLYSAFEEINTETRVVIPLHPRTRKLLLSNQIHTKCTIIDPVWYFDMIMLLKSCGLLITDSGGLQKEAFFFRKHCITVRDQTEWVELVNNGYNFIAGTNPDIIKQLSKELFCKLFPPVINLYGNGMASATICKALISHFE